MPNGDTVDVIRTTDGRRGTIPKDKADAAFKSGKFALAPESAAHQTTTQTPMSTVKAPGYEFGQKVAKGMGFDVPSLTKAQESGGTLGGAMEAGKQAVSGAVSAIPELAKDPLKLVTAPAKQLEQSKSFGEVVGASANILGGAEGAKKLPGAAKSVGKAAAGALEESRIAKSTTEIKKTITGAKSDFGPDLDRAIQRGYLPEIERQYNPKDVRGASDAVIETADKLQKNVIQEAINRHPTEMQGSRAVPAVISGDAIAQAILGNIRGIDVNLFPKNMMNTLREAQRYAGQNIPLKSAADLLEDLNAMDRSLREAAPESAAAARRINRSRAAVSTAANAVREQLYNKLTSLGEPQIAEFQKDYGSLRNIGELFRNNIARAEKIGKGPGLTESLFKQHPWYTMAALFGLGAGSEFGHAGVGAAGATIPFIRWAMERRGVPNATIERAMSRLGKVSKKPPSIEPPDPFRTGREMGVRGPRRAPFNRQIEEVGPRQALPAIPPPLLGEGEK